MAEIEEAVIQYLLAQTGLADLIGTKLYPEELPQKTELPGVTYIKISDVKDHLLTGQSNVDSPVFQFTVFSFTKSEARNVSNQIKKALKDYSGVLSGLVIQKIELENEITNKETVDGGILKVFTESLEFKIIFERSETT